MKRMILLWCTTALCWCSAHAQDYTLDITHQPYADLIDPIPVVEDPDPSKDLNYFIARPGFAFRAFGGNLVVDTAGGAMGVYISVHGVMGALETPGDSVLSFYGFWSNRLSGRSGARSSVSYKVEGAPDNTILKVQWKNMGPADVPTDSVNFQIWLHQRDNAISYHYGPSMVSSAAGFSGRPGPVVGLSKADPNFQKFYRSLYLTGSPGNPSVAFPEDLSIALNGVPAAGVVYTFRPVATAVVEHRQDAAFSCYPVPFRDVVAFTLAPSDREYRIVIVDAIGRERSSATGKERVIVQCGDCAAGVYFYRILRGTEQVATGLLVAD